MNPRRAKLVEMAFNKLDKDKSGTLTVDDLIGNSFLQIHI
jgi:hypothetical protein